MVCTFGETSYFWTFYNPSRAQVQVAPHFKTRMPEPSFLKLEESRLRQCPWSSVPRLQYCS